MMGSLVTRKSKEGFVFHLYEKDYIGIQILEEDSDSYIKAVMLSHIKKNTNALDIGANIGRYSVLFAKHAEKNNCMIHAYEPDPVNFEALCLNLRMNDINTANIECHNKAVAEKDGVLTLYKEKHNSGKNSLSAKNIVESDGECLVKICTIDENHKNDKISFIKIDVEGAEAHVLKGARETIKNNKNIVVIAEFSPFLLSNMGTNAREMLSFIIDEMQMKIAVIDEENKKIIEMPIDEVLKAAELADEKREPINIQLKNR